MQNLNYNIYNEIALKGMKMPDIAVYNTPSYGQCGEDLIVAALLRSFAITEQLDVRAQTYLEIGGNHPLACSATYLLHTQLGMTGVLVEANPDLIEALERFRPDDRVVHAAVVATDQATVPLYVANQDELSSLSSSFVTEWQGGSVGVKQVVQVPARHINALLQDYWPTSAPLYVSIDVEGCDLDLVLAMDLKRYRPAVFQIEPSEHHKQGSTRSIVACMKAHQYALVAQTDVNLIFMDYNRLGKSLL